MSFRTKAVGIALLLGTALITAPQMASAQQKAVNVAEWSAATDLLNRARKIIETKGWQQGSPVAVDAACMATAMERAFKAGNYSIVDFNYAREAMSRVLSVSRDPVKRTGDPLAVPYWGRSFMEWNDKPGRTKAEVLQAFKKAATLSNQMKLAAVRQDNLYSHIAQH